jgi:hypothetical protein
MANGLAALRRLQAQVGLPKAGSFSRKFRPPDTRSAQWSKDIKNEMILAPSDPLRADRRPQPMATEMSAVAAALRIEAAPFRAIEAAPFRADDPDDKLKTPC